MASLKACSDKAQSCASTFLKFKDYLPVLSEEAVTSVVSELFALSRSLLGFKHVLSKPSLNRYLDIIADDQRTVTRSIEHTLRDVQQRLSSVDDLDKRTTDVSRSRAQDAYRATWTTFSDYFADEGVSIPGCADLTSRVELYRCFISDLVAKLEGDTTSKQFKDLQYRMDKLLRRQERNVEEAMERMDRLQLSSPIPSFQKQKSWERRRPSKGRARDPRENRVEQRLTRTDRRDEQRSERTGRKAVDRLEGRRNVSESDYDHLVDSDEDDYQDLGEPVDYELELQARPDVLTPRGLGLPRADRRAAGISPFSPVRGDAGSGGYFVYAPEPPGSPSSSTAPSTLSSDTSSVAGEHWLPIVFNSSRSATPFNASGSESGCFGENMSGVAAKIKDEYDELLKLPFEDGQLDLRIYIRDEDRRARILVRQDRGSRKLRSCQPITSLRILRHESTLQLCIPERDRRQVRLWTTLRFPTYERLVLFWCSFHALKSQDEGQPITKLEDAALEDEKCLFFARIIDDNYEHELRILRDKDTKGVRLQASVLSGPMKRTPIWTAFITYQIPSTQWARRAEPRKVHLQELTRYIFTFTDDYMPQLGPRGEHELHFTTARDAKTFYQTIEDIAEHKI